MNTGQFLKTATKELSDSGIETARLDVLVLLEDSLGVDRSILLAHPETSISSQTEVELNKKIIQRSQHTPLAYIRGKVEFYGRPFKITNDVLVPRPETEAIIDLLLNIKVAPRKIADIGTGSGCIGITAALELNAACDLYDISDQALAVARQNAQELNATARLLKSNLLDDLKDDYEVILTNLPYVPENYKINQAASHEPELALFSGSDGMDLYRQFWQQINNLPSKPGHIITESFPSQHLQNKSLAELAGYRQADTLGFAQHFKLG